MICISSGSVSGASSLEAWGVGTSAFWTLVSGALSSRTSGSGKSALPSRASGSGTTYLVQYPGATGPGRYWLYEEMMVMKRNYMNNDDNGYNNEEELWW